MLIYFLFLSLVTAILFVLKVQVVDLQQYTFLPSIVKENVYRNTFTNSICIDNYTKILIIHFNILFQTCRPVLYDAQLVNQMIADVDRIDLTSIGTHALNANNDGDQDIELNAECVWIIFSPKLLN